MISVVQQSEEGQAPLPGGSEMTQSRAKMEPQFKALGVLYAKVENGTVEFVVLYEAHIDDVVKAEIAARFGVGAREWKP